MDDSDAKLESFGVTGCSFVRQGTLGYNDGISVVWDLEKKSVFLNMKESRIQGQNVSFNARKILLLILRNYEFSRALKLSFESLAESKNEHYKYWLFAECNW